VEELEEGGIREALAAGLGLSLTIILAAPWWLLFSLVLGSILCQAERFNRTSQVSALAHNTARCHRHHSLSPLRNADVHCIRMSFKVTKIAQLSFIRANSPEKMLSVWIGIKMMD
jgi:hypothetical protein